MYRSLPGPISAARWRYRASKEVQPGARCPRQHVWVVSSSREFNLSGKGGIGGSNASLGSRRVLADGIGSDRFTVAGHAACASDAGHKERRRPSWSPPLLQLGDGAPQELSRGVARTAEAP